MPSQFLYNPQSGMVPVEYTQLGVNRSRIIPPKTTEEFENAIFSPATVNLINRGFLKVVGPNQVVEKPQPPVMALPVHRYGPWVANVRIGSGYLMSHSGKWWLCVNPHVTTTAPSLSNADFELFSDLTVSEFSNVTGTSGEVVMNSGSGWVGGKITDANVTAISQGKVTGLTGALAALLPKTGGTMTGPVVLPATAPGATHALRKDLADGIYLAKTGGTLTGQVSLAVAPTAANHLANKAYVDSHAGLQTSGGTMTGLLALASTTPISTSAIRKDYADSTYLAKAGGTMTGPIVLPAATPTGLQAVSKQHLDGFLAAGFTSGPITWAGTPTVSTHLTTKAYVDALDVSGKVITTPIVWTGGVPTLADQLAPKSYVDLHMPKAGGTFTGPPIWATAPSDSNHLVNKTYADLKLPLAGGTIGGAIKWAGTPSDPQDLATKAYVDGAGSGGGLLKTTDGFGVHWSLSEGILDNTFSVGNAAASGALLLFTGGFKSTIKTLATEDRDVSFPNASGTVVLSNGAGADHSTFSTGAGAQRYAPTTVTLSGGGVVNTLETNTVGFTTPNSGLHIVELGVEDGWNRTINLAPGSFVKFIGQHGPSGAARALNGTFQVGTFFSMMGIAHVSARSTGFGTRWVGWKLVVTTVGAVTGPIAVTVDDDSVAATLSTILGGANNDVKITAVVPGDTGNLIKYEQTTPAGVQYETIATQSGTVSDPIITVALASRARITVGGSLTTDGSTPFVPPIQRCVVGILKNGKVWYTDNGLDTGYTSEIFWNSGTSRWNLAKVGVAAWLGTSGVTGDVADPVDVPSWVADSPATGTPTMTELISDANQVVASFLVSDVTAVTCALAPSNDGTGTSAAFGLTALEGGDTLGTVTAKYFAADGHLTTDLHLALAAAKAPIMFLHDTVDGLEDVTFTLNMYDVDDEPEVIFGGDEYKRVTVQCSAALADYIVS